AHARRRALHIARRIADPAHRFADRAEARPVAIRTRLTVAGDADHRQLRVDRVQHVPAKAEFFERAGTQILDHHVGFGGKPLDDLDAIRGLQVHAHGLLVARLQIPPERGAFMQLAPFAKGIAGFGRFDLDDVGAELGHEARGKGRGDESSDLDDANTLKGSTHDAVSEAGSYWETA